MNNKESPKYILIGDFFMNDFLNSLNLPFVNNDQNSFFKSSSNNCLNDLDLNKLLVIILLLTGNLTVEAITVFPNNFTITLGTFRLN